MASDVPAFLEVGTPVSAKFKGAFCEAAIKSFKKLVKCKVQFKDIGLSSAVISNEQIKGALKLNSVVQVKMSDEMKEATIQKMNDHSLYTVVFDDGDERTLRRTNVCVMGEKHFNENENLDNLPLTDPENFSSAVVMSADKRRKRRRSQPNCSIDEEDSDSDESKTKKWFEVDKEYLGKVVCIEHGERKKSWFPALGLKYFSSTDNQIYVQSFKDGKKILVKKDDIKDFSKEKDPLFSFLKGDTKIDPILRSAIEKALAYHDLGELPKGWNILDTIDEKDDSSEEDNTPGPPLLSAEAKVFHENLYAFMGRNGTPILKSPMLNSQNVDLHKLLELVLENGGVDEVTNQQWRSIYTKLGLRNMHTTAAYNMKTLYKKYLYPYEQNLQNCARSSPLRTSKPKQQKLASSAKDEHDNSLFVLESDSEMDRRRLTRSSRTATALQESEKKYPDSADSTKSEQDFEMKLLESEDVDVVNSPQSSVTSEDTENGASNNNNVVNSKYKAGNRICVHYGNGKNQRLYNAKILEVDKEENDEVVYFIHYNNWNHRYDEWVKDVRIAGLSTNTPNKKRHSTPPTSISKIAKEPPPRFKNKEDNSGHLTKRSAVVKDEKPNEKPPSPLKSPVYLHEAFKTPGYTQDFSFKSPNYTHDALPVEPPEQKPKIRPKPSTVTAPTTTAELFIPDLKPAVTNNALKSGHRPKPVTDALFIPDIKPSPIKPRMTRNSMQDTFLLNALEESIGKPNQAALSLQTDVLMKSEPRRRSVRQQPHHQSSKSESEASSKEEEKEGIEESTHEFASKKQELKSETMSNSDSDRQIFDKKIAHLDPPKPPSKEDSVKKWIEDSSKLLSCDTKDDEAMKIEGEEEEESRDENGKTRKGRRSKGGKREDKKKRKKECGSDCEFNCCSDKTINNNIATEKDRTSETAQTLSDFCNIVENASKMEETMFSPTKQTSPAKEGVDKSRKRKQSVGEQYKQKPGRIASVTNDDEIKTPKKEKGRWPALEYQVDFMSDLATVLAKKDSVERIAVMQYRLNEMSKLYCKLRTEVASIDRKKKRKLRKQLQSRRVTCS